MPVEILMPPLSQTADTLLLLEWLKKPGDEITKGEALFIVETDKASLEVEAPESGILHEILAQPQTEVPIRSVIGTILKKGEQPPVKFAHPLEQPAAPQATAADQAASAPPPATAQPASTSERLFSSPRARRFARLHGLNLSQVTPSGPRGMVVERDLEPLLKYSPQPPRGTRLSGVRKVIARRMLESVQGGAPVTYMSEADATQLVTLREQLLNGLSKNVVRPTFTDIFIRIACLALKEHPLLNATLEHDVLTRHSDIHMGMAVDSDRGLVVPVLRHADRLDTRQIALWRQTAAEKARSGKITAEEMSGGTFTITNLGALSVDYFTPIINPPQVAILGIGRIRQIPAVKDGGIFIRSAVSLALTCDHRVIDGAPAARFMHTLCQMIEQPGDLV